MMPAIKYSSGHQCIDNGAGDYDLTCPDYPNRKVYMPRELVRDVLPKRACPICLRLIGAVQ